MFTLFLPGEQEPNDITWQWIVNIAPMTLTSRPCQLFRYQVLQPILLPFTLTTFLNAPTLDASILAQLCKPVQSPMLIKFSSCSSQTTLLCGCHLYDSPFLCSFHRCSALFPFLLAMYLPQVWKMPFSLRISTLLIFRLLQASRALLHNQRNPNLQTIQSSNHLFQAFRSLLQLGRETTQTIHLFHLIKNLPQSIKLTPLFYLLTFYTSFMFTTCTGKIPTFSHPYIYPKDLFTRFSTCPVYQTEHGAD